MVSVGKIRLAGGSEVAGIKCALIASGYGEYQGNHIETTFVDQALVAGVEYEISCGPWVSGGVRLTRCLFHDSRTNILSVVPKAGPQVRYSRALANWGRPFTLNQRQQSRSGQP